MREPIAFFILALFISPSEFSNLVTDDMLSFLETYVADMETADADPV